MIFVALIPDLAGATGCAAGCAVVGGQLGCREPRGGGWVGGNSDMGASSLECRLDIDRIGKILELQTIYRKMSPKEEIKGP
jgi:hypothetical protein